MLVNGTSNKFLAAIIQKKHRQQITRSELNCDTVTESRGLSVTEADGQRSQLTRYLKRDNQTLQKELFSDKLQDVSIRSEMTKQQHAADLRRTKI